MRGGTYREHIDHIRLHPGTAEKPITVLAYPGENPVLVGTLSLRRPAYWLIDNLDVSGDPTAGQQQSFMVKVIGGTSWTWENSEFTDTVTGANVMITGWGPASRQVSRSGATACTACPHPDGLDQPVPRRDGIGSPRDRPATSSSTTRGNPTSGSAPAPAPPPA